MSSAAAKKPRPKYLSLTALLFEIRLPASAWVSGMHRISGALLFFPFAAWLLYLLDTSLASERGFQHVKVDYLGSPLAKPEAAEAIRASLAVGKITEKPSSVRPTTVLPFFNSARMPPTTE